MPNTEIDALLRNNIEVKDYTLSSQHEQRIAQAFTVLLADTDDPCAIGAVCLEEQPNDTELLVRTAVNSGNQEIRMASFGKIATALQQCTAGPSLNLHHSPCS